MKHIKQNVLNGNEREFNKFMQRCKMNKMLDEDGQIKIILIAHSMGGLVSQYYIPMLGGEAKVSKLIMLGTPNQGSMDALSAISEGEFPESILHFYRKQKTRPIIFSWPSMFQLLPRYPFCLKGLSFDDDQDLNTWGLGEDFPVGSDASQLDRVVENWIKHQLVPPFVGFDGASHQALLTTYLKEQIASSAYFYHAINGKFDHTYEEKRLAAIKDFGAMASIDVCTENRFIAGNAKTPYIVFGGNCESTVKNAHAHTSMVSNQTFQFNLLNEILWQSSCMH